MAVCKGCWNATGWRLVIIFHPERCWMRRRLKWSRRRTRGSDPLLSTSFQVHHNMPWSWDRWTASTFTVTSFTGKMHQPHWLANSVSVLAWRGVGCEGGCVLRRFLQDKYHAKWDPSENPQAWEDNRGHQDNVLVRHIRHSHDTVSPVFEHGKHRGPDALRLHQIWRRRVLGGLWQPSLESVEILSRRSRPWRQSAMLGLVQGGGACIAGMQIGNECHHQEQRCFRRFPRQEEGQRQRQEKRTLSSHLIPGAHATRGMAARKPVGKAIRNLFAGTFSASYDTACGVWLILVWNWLCWRWFSIGTKKTRRRGGKRSLRPWYLMD